MIESDLLQFEVVDGITVARYSSNKPITAEVAKILVQKRKEFTQNKPCKVAIVFPNLTSIDKGGRDYLSSDDAKENIEASAMVTDSVLGKVVVNFFLKLNNRRNNDIPNKVFNTEKDAIEWLKNLD